MEARGGQERASAGFNPDERIQRAVLIGSLRKRRSDDEANLREATSRAAAPGICAPREDGREQVRHNS